MKKQTDKTLSLLLSGKHPSIKKYAGKQVFVIQDKVLPIGKKGFEEFKKLKEKYGEAPVVTFVPDPTVSYILTVK
jgi:hypothetical protein